MPRCRFVLAILCGLFAATPAAFAAEGGDRPDASRAIDAVLSGCIRPLFAGLETSESRPAVVVLAEGLPQGYRPPKPFVRLPQMPTIDRETEVDAPWGKAMVNGRRCVRVLDTSLEGSSGSVSWQWSLYRVDVKTNVRRKGRTWTVEKPEIMGPWREPDGSALVYAPDYRVLSGNPPKPTSYRPAQARYFVLGDVLLLTVPEAPAPLTVRIRVEGDKLTLSDDGTPGSKIFFHGQNAKSVELRSGNLEGWDPARARRIRSVFDALLADPTEFRLAFHYRRDGKLVPEESLRLQTAAPPAEPPVAVARLSAWKTRRLLEILVDERFFHAARPQPPQPPRSGCQMALRVGKQQWFASTPRTAYDVYELFAQVKDLLLEDESSHRRLTKLADRLADDARKARPPGDR